MLVCKNIDGKSVHYIFNDFQCWSGAHIIHGAFAILTLAVFLSLSMIISLTYFKPIGSPNDASTKLNSRASTFVMIEKIIMAFTFTFLFESSYKWFLIVLINVLSVIAFIRFLTESPYHNERIGQSINIKTAIFSWANITLLICKILEHTSFNGGLQLFFLGIPLIFALIILRKDERLDKLMLNVGNFLKGEEVIDQVRFFLSLVSKKDSDKNYDIILKGYVFQHEDACPNDQCQLKQYKQSILTSSFNKSQKDKKKKQQQQQQLQMIQNVDNQQLLMSHAKNMFRIGIQKFPTNSSLRISYAFFLIEKMNKKNEALAELNIAQNLDPPFDEQFIIYRCKKLSEEYGDTQGSNFNQGVEDKSRQNSKSNLDLMNRFAYESNFRQLSIHIERCAQFHLEFWNQLREERPDVAKLGESGSHINQSINHVDSIWNQLQKLNSNVPKALRLYGKYLIDILHDKDGGIDLLQRAKDAANVKHNYYDGGVNMLEDLNDIQQMSSDGTPCIYVSGDLDKIGMITQSNAGATRIFGYSALEIKNHNVEKLMPEMYAKNHSKVLEDALMKGPENIPNKERLVFARHKSGYIFPVWLQLKMIQNVQNGVQFVALFKVDKKLMSSNIGFVLLNKDKRIQGISSSCMRLLNLDISRMRRLTSQGYDLKKLAPQLYEHGDDFQNTNNKQGVQIEWLIPKFERNKNAPRMANFGTIKPSGRRSKDLKSQGSILTPNMTQTEDSSPFNTNGRSSIKFGPTQNTANLISQSYTIVEQRFTLNVSVNNIIMGELGEIGYYLRIDSILSDKKIDSQAITQGISLKKDFKPSHNQNREKIKQPLFQFRFDSESGRFVRELKENIYQDNALKDPNFIDGAFVTPNYLDFDSSPRQADNSSEKNKNLTKKSNDKLDVSDVKIDINTSNDASKDNLPLNTSVIIEQQQLSNEELYNRRKKWARGIQTYRLVNGKFLSRDNDEESKKEKQIEDERKKKLQQEETNLLQLDTFKSNIKSRKALHMAINDQTVPPAIRNLRMTMNLVILCLLALAITEFTIITSQFKDINENFNLIQKSYGRISEIQRVAYDVRTLILINEGKLRNLQRMSTVPSFTEFLKQDIEEALNQIYDLQNYISLSTLSVSSQHQSLLEDKQVPLYYKESNTSFKILNFSLTESVLQISSAIFTVRHLNLSEFYEYQEDVYFVTYNVFNDFLIKLQLSSEYYLDELMSRSNDKNKFILILFLCSIGLVIMSMPILFPAVSSVNKAKVHVLSLFLDIPNHFIIDIGNQCENFLNSYHDDQQMDDLQSEDDDIQKAQNEKDLNSTAKRGIHKLAKNTAHTNRNFFMQFSFGVMGILAYFIAMFILANNYINNIEILSDEMSVAAKLESYFAFTQNVQREMIYNSNKTILNQDAFNVSRQSLGSLYAQLQSFLNYHHNNRGKLEGSYTTTFYDILKNDICSNEQFDLSLVPGQCSQLFSNAPSHGLGSVIIKYYETLRETLSNYKITRTINSIPATPIPTRPNMAVISSTINYTSTFKNNTELLNSQFFVDLYLMQFRFIQESCRNLIQLLKQAVNDTYQKNIDTRMATFIVYILVIALAYLVLWTPFLGKLNREIWRTKSMLTIIPIEIIMKIPKIQEYLNKQAMFNNKKQSS